MLPSAAVSAIAEAAIREAGGDAVEVVSYEIGDKFVATIAQHWRAGISMTDQQLPPCDTEPELTWATCPECMSPVNAHSQLCVSGNIQASFQAGDSGSEPSSDAQTDYDHIWRCIQQAARGE